MAKVVGTLILVMGLVLTGLTPAWGLRCGTDLISVGDRKLEVLQSCGEPDFADRWEEVRSGHLYYFGHWYPNTATVVIEEWSYNFGPSRFIRILRFENGRLENIDTSGYGF